MLTATRFAAVVFLLGHLFAHVMPTTAEEVEVESAMLTLRTQTHTIVRTHIIHINIELIFSLPKGDSALISLT